MIKMTLSGSLLSPGLVLLRLTFSVPYNITIILTMTIFLLILLLYDCSSMDPEHAPETLATLRFGEKCALVENSARNEADLLAGVLASLDEEIASLELDIMNKERWEVKEELRADVNAEQVSLTIIGLMRYC